MSSRTKAAHQLVIDAGPQGAGRSGHAHADALSVQLAVHGQLLLVDPGTFVYADLENQRNRFRGTGCHNTVLIDGLDQADTAGPFGWQRLPNVAAEFWRTGATFDLFVGSHDGYTRLENPVRHRRSIFYLRPSFWFVRDVFQGLGIHRFDVSWQFAPGSVSTIPEGATFSNGRNADLTLLFASDQSYSLAISQGWHSPAYGIKESSPVLGFSTKGRLPTEMCTVLIPAPACNAAPGRVKRLLGRDDCGVRAYCYQWGNQSTYLFFADEGRRWQFGPWSSDARFLAFSNISGQDSDQIVICDGSYLILDGRRILGGHSHFSSRELVLKRRNTLLSPQEFAVEYVPSF